MAEEDAILAANEAFYRVFANRDLDGMDELWARGVPVACVHPGWEALSGREAVMASWREILENPDSPAIACSHPAAFLFGDVALVICYELIEDSFLVATNLFFRERGEWKMVHHQAGPTVHRPAEPQQPEPPEVLH